jgi:hypothetical protein
VLTLSIYFNCRRHDQTVVHERLAWEQCLNGLRHPSGGAVQVSESYGCIQVGGACTIDPEGVRNLPPVPLDSSAPEALLLRSILARIEAVRGLVEGGGGSDLRERLLLVTAAELFAEISTHALMERDDEDGLFSLAAAAAALDLATDFVPGVSLAKDLSILLTGVNPVTGGSASAAERALIAGSVLVPGFVAGAGRGLAKLGRRLARVSEIGGRGAAAAGDVRSALAQADDVLARLVDDVPC